MEVRLTEEQRAAVDAPVAENLVSAAAGSGKTKVLSERIVKRIASGDTSIDRLLVVTFTRAAAAQMKEKITSALRERYEENKSDRLKRQISLVAGADICTIDSFCGNVLKKNFFRVNVPPDFSIADSNETEILKEEVLTDVLEECYEEGDENFILLSDSVGKGKNDLDLRNMILDINSFCSSFEEPEEWLDKAVEKHRLGSEENKKLRKILLDDVYLQLQDIAAELSELAEEADSLGIEAYYPTLLGDAERFKETFSSNDGDNIKSGFETFSFGTLPRQKKDPSLDDSKDYIKKRRDDVKAANKKAKELFEAAGDESYSSYDKIKALCTVVKKFRNAFTEEKLKRKELEFSDCEYFAFKALKSSEEAVDELRDKYDEIYIDEYQDTNPLQDALFALISKKSRGEENLFIVGDVKQSIYRFRHSDPTLFADKAKRFKSDGKERKMILSKNFRSREEIINSVNHVFEKIMREGTAQIEYNDEHRLKCGAQYIEYNQDISELYILSSEADPEREEEADLAREQRETLIVAERIRKMIDSGFLVTGEDGKMRPVRYSDFALLTRALNNTADRIVKIFELYSIPCECSAKRSFFDCMEIRTAMALLKAVDNPKNDIPLAALMRSPIFSFSENELLEIRLKGREKPFCDNVSDFSKEEGALGEKCRAFLETLSLWRTKASVFSVSEFLESAMEESGYYSFVGALQGGAARQENLRTLLNFAASYEKTRYKGLYNFVRYMDKTSASGGKIENEEGGKKDAVLVTSIHKSKGLEFPIVFLIGCSAKFNEKDAQGSLLLNQEGGIAIAETNPKTRVKFITAEYRAIKNMIVHDGRAEQMRLFYVALTRAKEKLILVASSKTPEEDIENALLRADKRRSDNAVRSMVSYYQYLTATVFDEPKLWKVEAVSRLPEIVKHTTVENTLDDDFEINEEASRRLLYKYPYDFVKSIPSKMSVSEIKRMAFEDGEMMYPPLEEKIVPKFAKKKERLLGSARGTAFHRVLELINFDENDVEGALKGFVNDGKLTKDEADCIDTAKIERFLSSPIGEMLKAAKKIYREEPFTITINASSVFENGGEEKICVQGTIDCFFETFDGKIILLDFKTDRYKDVEEMKTKYKKQLDLYELALYKRFLQKCDKKYLYLFHNDDIIEIM